MVGELVLKSGGRIACKDYIEFFTRRAFLEKRLELKSYWFVRWDNEIVEGKRVAKRTEVHHTY